MRKWFDAGLRATTEETLRSWRCGFNGGKAFLCGLCAHKFQLGDLWRPVYANGEGPCKMGNFITCESCDGDDVMLRVQRAEVEAEMAAAQIDGDIDA